MRDFYLIDFLSSIIDTDQGAIIADGTHRAARLIELGAPEIRAIVIPYDIAAQFQVQG